MLLAIVACPGATFAASTSRPIAVLDFYLGSPPYLESSIRTLDDNDVEVKGSLKVFQNHTTPLRPNGSSDLARIRTGTPSFVGSIELKRRGSSSLAHPKKNYSLDFQEAVNFLNMPTEKEWVLHSCWADKTCLRNVIGYWQAARLFPWAPRTEFAEVFINGYYRGLYVVVEKVKLGPYRVALPLLHDEAWGIDGAFILKRDGNDLDSDWESFFDSGLKWWFVSPKEKNLTQAHMDYIKRDMDSFVGDSIRGLLSYDPWEYDEWVDERSAADFVIIQEIANNVDAYCEEHARHEVPGFRRRPRPHGANLGPRSRFRQCRPG